MNTKQGQTAAIIIVILLLVLVGGYFFLADRGADVEDTDGEIEQAEYTVTIKNVSDSQPLSPGVFAVHTSEASLDFEGDLSPAALKPLAEYGDPAEFFNFVERLPGVVKVIGVANPIAPGGERTLSFTVSVPQGQELFLSGILMAVASNDGYAFIDSVALGEETVTVEARNFDNGTEENEALGSGFAGGQPDPTQGDANVENGTPTDPQAPVSAHLQLTTTIMEVTLTPIADRADAGAALLDTVADDKDTTDVEDISGAQMDEGAVSGAEEQGLEVKP